MHILKGPHIYLTCLEVYKSACEKLSDHCIILNGENGSGKTELFKYAVDFFAKSYCHNDLFINRINNSSSILEALGNASTPASMNSSRFFNYFELKFNQDGHLYAAKINDFRLENFRAVLDFPNEGNFLILCYLLAGLDPQIKVVYT